MTEEEATLIEGLIFDAKRAASKLHTMYLRSEIEPRLELDRLVEQRDLYLKAQKILRAGIKNITKHNKIYTKTLKH